VETGDETSEIKRTLRSMEIGMLRAMRRTVTLRDRMRSEQIRQNSDIQDVVK